jgi:3',5'-cyclic-AMP phosphodiesterase
VAVELTTVADDLVVVHDGTSVRRYDDLLPDTDHEFDGIAVRTLPRPPGELLSRVATVNDVHFGETECGRIDDRSDGPIVRPDASDPPHPETMNRAAAAEIAAIAPDAVIVKGDVSCDGTDDEFAAFEACYRSAFGDRLHVVRGNHDAYHGQSVYDGDAWITVPGLHIALLDTVIPTKTTGGLRPAQIEWLDDRLGDVGAVGAGEPVIVMGHHQQWIPGAAGHERRHDDYFGLHPDASNALDAVCARHDNVLGYAAGHTHRHRVRTMAESRLPSIEVGCVKDFPGTWAEYRVYEGGVMQIVHRISSPGALAWSERCRGLYRDFGVDYVAYAMGSLAERCFVFGAVT